MKSRQVPLLLAALLACPAVYAQNPPPKAAPVQATGNKPAAPNAPAGQTPRNSGNTPAPVPGRPDPFIKEHKPSAQPPIKEVRFREGIVRLEYYSMPMLTARQAMKQMPQQEALYAWLDAELEKQQTEVKFERVTVLRVRGGQRSKVEEIAEYPYPTEFDPPQIPQTIGLGAPPLDAGSAPASSTPVPPVPPVPPTPGPAPAGEGAKGAPGTAGAEGTPASPPVIAAGAIPANQIPAPWPYTPVTANSFEFKGTGWMAEMELVFTEDGRKADINMAPSFVRLNGTEKISPTGEVVQPSFESQRISTQIFVNVGEPTFVGTYSKPVNTGVTAGNTEDRTWFLFLTVNSPR